MYNKAFKIILTSLFICISLAGEFWHAEIYAIHDPYRLDNDFNPIISDVYDLVLNPKIYLDNTLLDFKDKIVVINDTMLVSLNDIRSNFKFDIIHYYKDNIVTTFYKNNFIKFIIGQNTAYVNGHYYKLEQSACRLFGEIYLPFEFIMRIKDFDVNYHYIAKSDANPSRSEYMTLNGVKIPHNQAKRFDYDKIYLTNRNSKKLNMKNGKQFVYTKLSRYDLGFFIPAHWKNININIFGRWDEYSQYKMMIERQFLKKNQSILEFSQEYRNAYVENNPDIEFSEVQSLTIGSNKYEQFNYNDPNSQFPLTHHIYLLNFGNEVFIFSFQYNHENHQAFDKYEYYDILESVHKINKSINTFEEHYVEFTSFFQHNLRINHDLYSNMDVDGSLDLAGSIKSSGNTMNTKIYALVQKENESIEFQLPLESKHGRLEFSSKIYTPFGLGKHNLTIYKKDDPNDRLNLNNTLLKCSLINLSININRYLIPTQYVISDSTIADSLASILTLDATNDIEKSELIFKYITSEIKLNDELPNLNQLRNSDTVIDEKIANPLEINIALCAVLRNRNIPSKIYVGEVGNRTIYFVEAELNGKNRVLDPVSQIMYNNGNSLQFSTEFPFNKSSNFSNLNADYYKNFLKGYKLLLY